MATIPSFTAMNDGLGNVFIDSVNESYVPYIFEDDTRQRYQTPYAKDFIDDPQRNTGLESLRQLKMVGPGGMGDQFAIPGGMQTTADINTTDKYILPFEGARTIIKNKNYIPLNKNYIPLNMDKFAGIMQATDIDDDQSDEVIEQQNFFQKLMNNSFMANLIQGIGSLFKPTQSGIATRDLVRRGYGPTLQNLYGPGGLMQGYNMISHRGPGPLGSITNRRNKILKRIAEGKNYSEGNLQKLNQAITSLGGDAQQPSLANFATKKAAARSPKVGVSGYTKADDAREARRTGQYG